MIRRIIPALFAATLLASCATIIDKEMQEITIETPGARHTRCTLFNGDFKYMAHPPQTLTISNRPHDLEVTCQAPGNRVIKQTFGRHVPDSVMGNVAFGIAPGLVADYASGALYKYPEKIVVDFSATTPRPYPLPDHHLNYLENPAVAGMEEFRPGTPSLIRDQYETIPTMQKREFPVQRGSEVTGDLLDDTPSTGSTEDGAAGEAAPAATGESSSSKSTSESSADSLTKSANPSVFQQGDPAVIPASPNGNGFVGGTSNVQETTEQGSFGKQKAPMDGSGPVQLYPVE